MKKALISLLIICIGFHTYADHQSDIADRLSDKYLKKISRFDTDLQIEKIEKISVKIQNLLLSPSQTLNNHKARILVGLNNNLCEYDLSIGGAYCPLITLTESPTPSMPSGPTEGQMQELIRITNNERLDYTLQTLTENSQLSEASNWHAQYLCNTQQLSHSGENGSTPAKRATDAGYNWSYVGENIGGGYSNPQTLHDDLMDSPGHRANILNPEYEEIGIGRCNGYWVIMFGRQ